MPAITPADTPRPVVIAVRLLYAIAALAVLSAVLKVVLHANQWFILPLSVVAVLLNVLVTYYVGRGKNVARILVWLGTAMAALSLVNPDSALPGGSAGHPGWYFPYLLTQLALQLVVQVAASVLLALPASRPYFRHRPPVVVPGSQLG